VRKGQLGRGKKSDSKGSRNRHLKNSLQPNVGGKFQLVQEGTSGEHLRGAKGGHPISSKKFGRNTNQRGGGGGTPVSLKRGSRATAQQKKTQPKGEGGKNLQVSIKRGGRSRA